MATTRKTAVRKTAARKTAPRKTPAAKRSSKAAPRAGAAFPKIEDLGKLVGKFKLPGIDVAAIVESQRKDMEALVDANRQAYEGIQALAKRRNELLKEAFTQWQAAMKDSTGSGALSKQAALAKKGVQKAIADVRELADMEAASRKKAWKVVQDRFDENLGNLKKMIQPKA